MTVLTYVRYLVLYLSIYLSFNQKSQKQNEFGKHIQRT